MRIEYLKIRTKVFGGGVDFYLCGSRKMWYDIATVKERISQEVARTGLFLLTKQYLMPDAYGSGCSYGTGFHATGLTCGR